MGVVETEGETFLEDFRARNANVDESIIGGNRETDDARVGLREGIDERDRRSRRGWDDEECFYSRVEDNNEGVIVCDEYVSYSVFSVVATSVADVFECTASVHVDLTCGDQVDE